MYDPNGNSYPPMLSNDLIQECIENNINNKSHLPKGKISPPQCICKGFPTGASLNEPLTYHVCSWQVENFVDSQSNAIF